MSPRKLLLLFVLLPFLAAAAPSPDADVTLLPPDGYILTNNHVVAEADSLIVRLSDNTPHRAKVVGTDPYTDLALLKVEAGRPIPSAKLGNSDLVKVGQWSIAVGDPFGIARTYTV